MDKDFEDKKAVYKKTLAILVEMKYITINEFISEDGIAAMFVGDLEKYERKQKIDEAFSVLLRMKQFFPLEVKAVMEILEK